MGLKRKNNNPDLHCNQKQSKIDFSFQHDNHFDFLPIEIITMILHFLGVVDIQNLIKSCKILYNLFGHWPHPCYKKLNLIKKNINIKLDSKKLADYLELPRYEKLKSFTIENGQFEYTNFGKFIFQLKQHTQLDELAFIRCKLATRIIKPIIATTLHFHNLLILNFSKTRLQRRTAEFFAEILSQFNSLVVLNITECILPSKYCQAILKSLLGHLSLKELRLSANIFNDEVIFSLADLMKKLTITILDVSYCGITSYGMQILGVSLYDNNSLIALNLKNNSLNTYSAILFSNYIRKTYTLRYLNLSFCRLNGPITAILCEGLSVNKSIETFDISRIHCPSDDYNAPTITSIGHILSRNSIVKTLRLNGIKFGNTHFFKQWAIYLAENRTLLHLELSWNSFNPPQITALSKAIIQNNTLQTLSIIGIPYDGDTSGDFLDCLIKNTSLRWVNISSPWRPWDYSKIKQVIAQKPNLRLIVSEYDGVSPNEDFLF